MYKGTNINIDDDTFVDKMHPSLARFNRPQDPKSFSGRCLNRIQLISSEIVTAEEQAAAEDAEQTRGRVAIDTEWNTEFEGFKKTAKDAEMFR